MFIATYAPWIAVTLIMLMIGAMYAGWRIGRVRQSSASPANVGTIEAAVFALLGLLIAFTFSHGVSRFDLRRDLIVDEANDIGTAYLRIDLLPTEAQPEMRRLFRKYLEARLEVYRLIPDMKAAYGALDRSAALQKRIWRYAVDHSRDQPSPSAMLLLPSLNAMIDITTTRTMAAQFHPPTIIFVLLIGFSLLGAFTAGLGMSGTTLSWIHVVVFSIAMTMTIYVIFDVEYPRLGFIRIDQTDQVLMDLRKSMD